MYNSITMFVETYVEKEKRKLFKVTPQKEIIAVEEIPSTHTLAKYWEDDNYEAYVNINGIKLGHRFNLIVFLFSEFSFHGDVYFKEKKNESNQTKH